jgi:hypothetical protein
MKFAIDRPLADPDQAARKLVDRQRERGGSGRPHLQLINGPFLKAGGTPNEYRAGIERAIAKGWLWLHESGTYVKFTQAGAELFA